MYGSILDDRLLLIAQAGLVYVYEEVHECIRGGTRLLLCPPVFFCFVPEYRIEPRLPCLFRLFPLLQQQTATAAAISIVVCLLFLLKTVRTMVGS